MQGREFRFKMVAQLLATFKCVLIFNIQDVIKAPSNLLKVTSS